MKKIAILIFVFCLQINGYAQREDFFSVSTKYLTPSYDVFGLIDEDIEGITSLFTTLEGSVNVSKWLRIGGGININDENDKILNAALRIGIKRLEFSYETGNFQGSIGNTIPIIADDEGLPIKVGKFSNKFKSFAIFLTISDYSDQLLTQVGLGVTTMSVPTTASVLLDNIVGVDYIDPETKVTFYAFHQKTDVMYSRLSRTSPVSRKVNIDFSSANIAGVATFKASDFGKEELESIIRNGIDGSTSYANPDGYISNDRKAGFGIGISSDTRIGIGYTNKQDDKKLAFAVAAGYSFRFYALLSFATFGEEPDGDEYFQSAPQGASIIQHGPYLKAQINW